MGDLLGVELLSNPAVMGGEPKLDIKMADLVDIQIPSISEERTVMTPKLAPTFEETGPVQFAGLDNLNASQYSSPMPRMSDETIMKEKYEILRKFERLSKLGVPMRKRFTIDSPLEEMKMELEFIKREKSMDTTIKQFSEWFVTGMSAMEWGSQNIAALKMFGLDLQGLSESAQMNVVDMEDDFEELYELYGEKVKMHPLVRIPLKTCMMIYMVHLTNQMARKAPIPNINDIMRQNPDIARTLASAAMQNQTTQMRNTATPPPPSNPMGGMMNFMQGMLPQGPPPAQQTKSIPKPNFPKASLPTPPAPKREMRPPPAGIAELLKSIGAPPANAPPLPPPVEARPKSAMKKSPGSTGKNSVVIKL
jgi:hypothetical protein